MTGPQLYEDFTEVLPADSREAAAMKAARDAGYEDGYRKGWDDAERRQQDSAEAITADLQRSVSDLKSQASDVERMVRAAIAIDVADLFDKIICPILPELALAQATDCAQRAIGERSDLSVSFAMSPVTLEKISKIYDERDEAGPEGLVEDDTLVEDQIVVRVDDVDHSLIDHEPLLMLLRETLGKRVGPAT